MNKMRNHVRERAHLPTLRAAIAAAADGEPRFRALTECVRYGAREDVYRGDLGRPNKAAARRGDRARAAARAAARCWESLTLSTWDDSVPGAL